MQDMDVKTFGRSLIGDHEFLDWLGGFFRKRRLSGARISVKYVSASHLSYIIKFGRDAGACVKFFEIPTGSFRDYDAKWAMENEYKILSDIFNHGFNRGKYRIVKPLGINKRFYAALATEYAGETSVYNLLEKTAQKKRGRAELKDAMKKTAKTIRKFHDNMSKPEKLDMNYEIRRMIEETTLGYEDKVMVGKMKRLIRSYKDDENIKRLGAVTVHGDTNSTNFIVNGDITYFLDLERLEYGRSPLHDLGFILADLIHQFKFHQNAPEKAEKYAEIFLKSYSSRFYDLISKAVRPYIGCSLIKITSYIGGSRKHRDWLREEGFEYLRKDGS